MVITKGNIIHDVKKVLIDKIDDSYEKEMKHLTMDSIAFKDLQISCMKTGILYPCIGVKLENGQYSVKSGKHIAYLMTKGKEYFENGYNNSEKWYFNQNIPELSGKYMLAYLAWRENFSIPFIELEIREDGLEQQEFYSDSKIYK